MGNFEYIIASLPVLTSDYRYAEGKGFGSVLAEIRDSLSDKDNGRVDFLLKGFEADALDEGFYNRALRERNDFLREYFRFDLNLRNAKVRFLNKALGRAPEQDLVLVKDAGEFEEAAKAAAAFALEDLMAREKALDDLTWTKIDTLTTFHYFDINAVLGYIARLHIVDRWLSLDEAEGRRRFALLVKEVKGTYEGVKFEE